MHCKILILCKHLLLNYEMFCYLAEEKKDMIDPKVIELNDNSETDEDLDYIPPSPISEKSPPTMSEVEKRLVFLVYGSLL